MGGFKTGWYEREEVAQVTLDWVRTNCRNITNREKELLKIIEYRRILRRDHIPIIHEGYKDVSLTVLNRSINKLFHKLCIDKIHEQQEIMKGNTPAFLSLDRAGAILLSEYLQEKIPFKRRILHEKKIRDNRTMIFRKLPATYKHNHGVNCLEITTRLFCQKTNSELIRWDLEQDTHRPFVYSEKEIIRPDAFCILRIADKPFLFFLEYDTGSENFGYRASFPTLKTKLRRYQYYMLSNSWKNERWFQLIKTKFPPIIFVTEEKRRINYLRKIGRALGLRVIPCLPKDYENILLKFLENSHISP